MPRFDGADYDHARDAGRLTGQLADIVALMKDGVMRTLGEMAADTGHPQASISAQLRHLRKPRFGAHEVQKTYLGGGLYGYKVVMND